MLNDTTRQGVEGGSLACPPEDTSGTVNRAGDFSLTIRAMRGDTPGKLVSRLAAALKERDATVLLLLIYGDCAAHEETTKLLRRYLGALDWPILWTQGGGCDGPSLACIQAYAVEGHPSDLQRLVVAGRVVGSTYSDVDARHCLIGGIVAKDTEATPAVQTEEVFANLEQALEIAGFEIADLARTWFYNDKLLDWYGDFNRVRTSYYSKRPFRMGAAPASTGISGKNPDGSALTVGAWAVRPQSRRAVVSELQSPLQCAATSYGSSFSRAVEIVTAGKRRVLVSGTASIEPGGKSVRVGDIRGQIELTMEVIEAILQTRKMGFPNVTRALAYCKDRSYAPLFAAWLKSRGLGAMPYAPVHSDICREDLLFEVELDACASLAE